MWMLCHTSDYPVISTRVNTVNECSHRVPMGDLVRYKYIPEIFFFTLNVLIFLLKDV